MRLALLLALLLLCSGPTRAEDDDELAPLRSPGVEESTGLDDGHGGADDFYEDLSEEDEGEHEALIGLDDDSSAERMEGMADELEREAEDEGEPKDPLTEDADDFGDPFADVMKDPYEDDEPDEPPTEIDGSTSQPDEGAEGAVVPPSPPGLGSPLHEEPPEAESPLDGAP